MEDIFVIIPTYRPKEDIMLPFIDDLRKQFTNIIIVNDGNGPQYSNVMKKLAQRKLLILDHEVNLGKGMAIKTALNKILSDNPSCKGIVVADCDGQHSVKDIKKCANAVLKNPNKFIIGVRDFNNANVPLKSRIGNKLTRMVVSLFVGIKIKDTQTGLRAMSFSLAKTMIKAKGERYEYETNQLIICKEKNIDILQIPIQTIYINNNETSSFNPIKDSIAIYSLFFKYVIVSISSFVIDIILYTIIFIMLRTESVEYSIIFATIFARILSSIYNFILNEKLVFKKGNKSSFFKYVALVIIQMLVSAGLVHYINLYIDAPVVTKVIIDTIIFIVNFIIQREIIFIKAKKK